MAHTPPGPPSGPPSRKPPVQPLMEAYGDPDGDETNVNVVPPVQATPPSHPHVPPHFASPSPSVSHQPFGGPPPMPAPLPGPPMSQVSGVIAQPTPYVSRSRIYAFVVDETGMPIELGSGRFAKAYLGEERWVESKTTLRRPVAIKCLQRGVSGEDQMRFQMEKEILERVQGHPNIVELLGSGEGDSAGFIPPPIREKVENDFMILELLDMSLEERLKGARQKRRRDDLLAVPLRERIFRVLEYLIPVATAVEFSHLVRDTCHRDIKPANILVKLPDPNLRGAQMKVKLADFNVGKVADAELELSMTRFQAVPGTLYFQSPEQETNTFELLVNCTQGSPEVEFFEDFYIDIFENDTFSLFNRNELYSIAAADRTRKKILLNRPFAEASEINVRARVVKSVGRPADIYSLGAVFYYLISGAYANPKNLYDAFRKFVEYERRDENNSIAAYIEHEYRTIQNMRAPKGDGGAPELAPEDRFFSYKHYLDGNGELIDPMIMMIIAKAMIRNKPDSYCLSYDLRTTGISAMVHDLLSLYVQYGIDPQARIAYSTEYTAPKKSGAMRRAFDKFFRK
ncbi:MAG TPA: protein kinase [Kofleriaceae bacterium]|nr:protein kinase [Kofleriaceae bacterium]